MMEQLTFLNNFPTPEVPKSGNERLRPFFYKVGWENAFFTDVGNRPTCEVLIDGDLLFIYSVSNYHMVDLPMHVPPNRMGSRVESAGLIFAYIRVVA